MMPFMAYVSVDFPLPAAPVIPTNAPAGMLKLISLTTGSVLSRYVNVKFLISIMVKLLL